MAVFDLASAEVSFPAAALDRSHAPYPGARPPVWDGDHLVFNAEDRGAVVLCRVPADGSAPFAVAVLDVLDPGRLLGPSVGWLVGAPYHDRRFVLLADG